MKGATSDHACIWCKIHKLLRYDIWLTLTCDLPCNRLPLETRMGSELIQPHGKQHKRTAGTGIDNWEGGGGRGHIYIFIFLHYSLLSKSVVVMICEHEQMYISPPPPIIDLRAHMGSKAHGLDTISYSLLADMTWLNLKIFIGWITSEERWMTYEHVVLNKSFLVTALLCSIFPSTTLSWMSFTWCFALPVYKIIIIISYYFHTMDKII